MNPNVVRHCLAMSGRVIRYACWPTITTQTVGEHSWQVARVYAALWGPPETRVAHYIQNHDSEELIVGDPPFPVKRDNPDLKAACDRVGALALEELGVELPVLSEVELARVKVCDLLEMCEYGMHERELGNLLAVPIVERTSEGALDVAAARLGPEEHGRVREYLEKLWERHESVVCGTYELYARQYDKMMDRIRSREASRVVEARLEQPEGRA